MTEPEGFEDFWLFWRKTARHTDGRGKCRQMYQRQIKLGATPEDILLAAQWHVANTKDMGFMPLAATWLFAEAWRDEAPKQRMLLAAQAERSNVVQMIQTPKSKWLQEWEASKREA